MDSGTVFALLQQASGDAGTVNGAINFSVSIGDLVSVATSIIAAVAAYTRLAERLTTIETKLGPMWEDWLSRRASR